MLNTTGILTVLDRGVTINWDDGPTLHRITAQVRYHTAAHATPQLMRVLALQRASDDPLIFSAEDRIKADWIWREEYAPGSEDVVFWTARMAVTNQTTEDIFLDALEVLRIDSAYSGQFNVGAPTGLWRCAVEGSAGLSWESWPGTTPSAGGFTRQRLLLVQPSVSNRSRPPAVLIRSLTSDPDSQNAAATEIKLELSGERFERLVVRTRTDGVLLRAGATLFSTPFQIASGDDPAELLRIAETTGTPS